MSGLFEGIENKEIYIIGAVLLFVLIFNNFSFTGLAHSRDDYWDRNSRCENCFERTSVRQEVSMAARSDVGRISPDEYRSMSIPQGFSRLGEPCYSNDMLGVWRVEVSGVYCDVGS